MFQAVISFIGYTGAKTENSCIIDFYIAVKGMLIVSYFLVWLIFTNFGKTLFIAQDIISGLHVINRDYLGYETTHKQRVMCLSTFNILSE